MLAFLDDILIMGMSYENHLKNLEEAFERFWQYGLKLKPRKCILFQSEVDFLGRIVNKKSVKDGGKRYQHNYRLAGSNIVDRGREISMIGKLPSFFHKEFC